MSVEYRCQDGDVLDRICWKHYDGRAGAVEAVLEANPGLADRGEVYEAGLVILLPDLEPAENLSVIRLWD